jgi:SsrA-binding protein
VSFVITKSGPPAGGQKKQKDRKPKIIAENRKARHEYDVIDTVVAGLVLVGSEVKTLRNSKGNIAEGFVRFQNGEAFLVDSHIPPYPQAHQFNHEPRRERKLLLKAAELDRWETRVKEKGLTVIPLKLYFDGPWAKLEIGLCKGRKLHDKRDAIKAREDRREIDREIAGRRRG